MTILTNFANTIQHFQNEDTVNTVRRHLQRVTVDEIQHRVDAFFGSSTLGLTDEDIRAKFNKIVCPGGNSPMAFAKDARLITEATNFYRGRWIADSAKDLKTTADIWEPRSALVKNPGRLNSSGESILYTSVDDPTTAVHECRFAVGDTFAMSRFEAKSSFQSTHVGVDLSISGLNTEEIRKLDVIQDFLYQAFSAKVSSTDPDPYRVSRLIALDYFDLPPQMFKGWAFRSVVDPSDRGWNVSFRPEVGRKALRYKETHVYRLLGFDADGRIPLTEFIAVLNPVRGDALSQRSPEYFESVAPFWP